MITLRKASERGRFDFGWLDTRHTFSFGDYYDPKQMGFRALRVINEDRVRPAQGFGTHGHRDMEIITWVLDGALEHKDSLGTQGRLTPGTVQRMSAGTGMRHSEFNGSASEPVHFYQIWIMPDKQGVPPRYEDRAFPAEGRKNRLQLLASPDGADGSLAIHRNARLYAVDLDAGSEVTLELPHGFGWVQAAKGKLELGHGFTFARARQGKEPAGAMASEGSARTGGPDCAGEWASLSAGDGAAAEGESKLVLRADGGPTQALVFELA